MKTIKKLKYPLTIIISLLIIIFCIILKKKLNNNKYENIEINEELKLESDISKSELVAEEKCTVDIKGAVEKPNVYSVECNNTVNDIIKLAGGLSKNADTSVINLAKKISNEMVIIIYTKDEVKNSNIVETVVKVVENECICPNIQNDGCINDKITDTIGNEKNSDSNNSLININTATKEKLQTIPGIGEAKAKAIIKYREENGNFKSIEDIKNVDGIGNKLYEEIKAYITA